MRWKGTRIHGKKLCLEGNKMKSFWLDAWTVCQKAVMGLPFSLIAAYLGGYDTMLKTLLLFMVLDQITGILASGVEGRISSKIGYKGIVRKVGILIVVAIAYQVDQLAISEIIGVEGAVRNIVIFFYIGLEGISNLENLGRCNVPLPSFLIKAFEILKDRGDKK